MPITYFRTSAGVISEKLKDAKEGSGSNDADWRVLVLLLFGSALAVIKYLFNDSKFGLRKMYKKYVYWPP